MTIAHLLLVGLIGIQQVKAPSADEIMQRVRQAMNFSVERIPEAGLVLKGTYTSDGVVLANIRMHFNRQGHFFQRFDSVLGNKLISGNELSGYDGKVVWVKNHNGESELLELNERRESLLWGTLISGIWIDKSSGMAYTLARDLPLPDEFLLEFTHEPSKVTGIISIDKKSLLPRKCKFASFKGAYVIITWKETLNYEGMKWPRKIETAINDTKLHYEWDSATAAPKTIENPFRPRISPPTNVSFDSSKDAPLEVMKSKSGELLVRPLINGQDVGWFLLSGGFGGNVLHEQTAKKMKLETYCDEEARVLGRSVKANWSRLKTISLGRMTLQSPLVYTLDLPADLNFPLAGIIGEGTFRCSVIELDPVTSQIALFDPATYEQERGKKKWHTLYVSKGLGVEAELEGHKGVFRLDIGSPKNWVDIHSPAVKKLKLLEGREVKDTYVSAGKEIVKKGKLKYFEIGGHRHDDVEASFATSETGVSSDHDYSGSIGYELLKPFLIVVDCQNRRIAFVKRDSK